MIMWLPEGLLALQKTSEINGLSKDPGLLDKNVKKLKILLKNMELIVQQLAQCDHEVTLHHKSSIQIACYPGNGARYTRHIDSFASQKKTADEMPEEKQPQRIYTLLYYLTDNWKAEYGGCLRAYTHSKLSSKFQHSKQAFWDVEPK